MFHSFIKLLLIEYFHSYLFYLSSSPPMYIFYIFCTTVWLERHKMTLAISSINSPLLLTALLYNLSFGKTWWLHDIKEATKLYANAMVQCRQEQRNFYPRIPSTCSNCFPHTLVGLRTLNDSILILYTFSGCWRNRLKADKVTTSSRLALECLLYLWRGSGRLSRRFNMILMERSYYLLFNVTMVLSLQFFSNVFEGDRWVRNPVFISIYRLLVSIN